MKVTFNYEYTKKDTGLTQGTNDNTGQAAYNTEKAKLETSRTEVYNGLNLINWGQYQASSGLELVDKNVDNFNLGPVEAYCSESGAVVKKCSQADINCFDPPCKCNKDTGDVTKCSKYTNMLIAVEAPWLHDKCARLLIERSGFELWLGQLCCVVGQDNSLSPSLIVPLSTQAYQGYQRIKCRGLTL